MTKKYYTIRRESFLFILGDKNTRTNKSRQTSSEKLLNKW